MSVYHEPVPANQEGGAATPTPEQLGYSGYEPIEETRTRKKRRRTLGAAAVGTAAVITIAAMLTSGKETPTEAYIPSTSTTLEIPTSTPMTVETTAAPTTIETPEGWREGKVMLAHQPERFALTMERMPTKEDIPTLLAHTLNSIANYDVINGGQANPPATIAELKEVTKAAGITLDDGMWRLIEEDRKPNMKYSYSEKIGSSYTVDPASVRGLGPNPAFEGWQSERYPNLALNLQKGKLKTYDSENTVMYEPFPDAKGGIGFVHANVARNATTGKVTIDLEMSKFSFDK